MRVFKVGRGARAGATPHCAGACWRQAAEDLDPGPALALPALTEDVLARYRLGAITFVEVREVQNTLTRLRSRLLQAQFDAKRAETDLLLLSGRLLERFR